MRRSEASVSDSIIRYENSPVPAGTGLFFFAMRLLLRYYSGIKLFLGNSANRALSFASTAVDAGISIDNEMLVTLGNSLYGALNNTCHINFPPIHERVLALTGL